jgi:hypothetical protein
MRNAESKDRSMGQKAEGKWKSEVRMQNAERKDRSMGQKAEGKWKSEVRMRNSETFDCGFQNVDLS